ncbi:Ribonuclease H domain [Sesbania bispinosa]|nr:Ribonuclease H domain [Sesbania bispinosa]
MAKTDDLGLYLGVPSLHNVHPVELTLTLWISPLIHHAKYDIPDWKLNLPCEPPDSNASVDYPAWKFAANGEFSIKTVYDYLMETSAGRAPMGVVFKTICERLRRGMTNSDLCPGCQVAPENLIHLLRDCEVVAELWESLIDQNNCYAKRVIEVVASPNPITHRIYKKEELISWSKPPANFYKLNVDGSVMAADMQASCWGLIRDHNGTFVKGFSCKIGIRSTVKAELWGLLHGLKLACSLNLSNLIINVDSPLAVQLVKGKCHSSHHCYSLIRSIRNILSDNSSFVLSHALRESNRSADHLAGIGQSQNLGIIFHDVIPNSLWPFLIEDCRGVWFPRLVVRS